MSQRMVVSEEALHEVLAFLFSSADMPANEPGIYVTVRLVRSANR